MLLMHIVLCRLLSKRVELTKACDIIFTGVTSRIVIILNDTTCEILEPVGD